MDALVNISALHVDYVIRITTPNYYETTYGGGFVKTDILIPPSRTKDSSEKQNRCWSWQINETAGTGLDCTGHNA